NGRNFEYFSEDPYLTGKCGAAVVKGIKTSGADATVKHFACNNQELARNMADSIVSERAVREMYLKGFEMAVKEGHACSIMTSYNPLNGHWS
ncbi:glycoside hydrolase family 3 N-terminal domain-containing protein, partial [Acinetobacter baumannii]|nr:glycoside hydrolase family 3 N-terminal domain-containing protein [Acinetobacter baumannii]